MEGNGKDSYSSLDENEWEIGNSWGSVEVPNMEMTDVVTTGAR